MRAFETLENRIIIAITNGGRIIGKVAEGIMINPRAIEIAPTDKENQVNIIFRPLFGDPTMFFYEYGIYYISENSELNELYENSIEPKRIITP